MQCRPQKYVVLSYNWGITFLRFLPFLAASRKPGRTRPLITWYGPEKDSVFFGGSAFLCQLSNSYVRESRSARASAGGVRVTHSH